MRRRIAVVTDEPGWHGKRLKAAFAARGLEAVFVSLAAGRLEVRGDGAPVRFPGFDDVLPAGVFVRGISGGSLEQLILRLDLLHLLETWGVKVYNPTRGIELSVDKGIASALLARAGVPTPPTWITADSHEALAIAAAEFSAGHRLVSKPLFGSQGEGVMLHDRADSIAELAPAGMVYYLQRFVGSHPPRDYRVFVVAGKAVAAMCRHGADWRTNVAQGGRCERAKLDNTLSAMAEKAARTLLLDYAGVDIICDGHSRAWVLEVNGIPAWKGLQGVCDLDVTSLLVEDFMRLSGLDET